MKMKFPSTNGAAGDVQGGLSKVHGCVHSSRSFKFIHQSRKLPTWTLLRENPLGKSPSQKVILEFCTKKNLVSVEKEHWGNFNYNEVRCCEILQSPVKTTELLTFPFLLWLLGNSSIAVTFFFMVGLFVNIFLSSDLLFLLSYVIAVSVASMPCRNSSMQNNEQKCLPPVHPGGVFHEKGGQLLTFLGRVATRWHQSFPTAIFSEAIWPESVSILFLEPCATCIPSGSWPKCTGDWAELT